MTTAYVTYTYYTTTYLGSSIASDDFGRLALRASAIIDQLTFNRTGPVVVTGTDTITIDAIKMAACAVAEEYQQIEQSGGTDGIASESIGSNSVSYTKSATAQLSQKERYARAASLYLNGTGLMFKGFDTGEYGGDYGENV